MTPRTPSSRIRRARLPLCLALAAGGVIAWAAPLLPVVTPPENPANEAKRALGKMLFWDEQLSSDDTISCGTCHIPDKGGADPRRARHPGADGAFNTADDVFGSPGVVHRDAAGNYVPHASFGLGAQVTGRMAPSFLTGALADSLFWDGRATSRFVDPQTGLVSIATGGALESQAVGPVLSSTEMAVEGRTWDEVTAKLATAAPLALSSDIPPDVAALIAPGTRYPELFRAAFGDETITAERIAFAIATYERTLVPDQTPWDRYTAGDTSALTPQQIRGLGAFQASKCNDCHEAPEFTDRSFRNIGLRPPAEDLGRQGVTSNAADRGKFKVPSLRNVGLLNSFMHGGQMTTLTDVLRFYARAPGTTQFTDNRDPLIAQINLPPQAAGDIQALLQTGLTDPRAAAEQFPFDYPTPYSETMEHGPAISGAGRAGTGARTPQIVAVMPPYLGNGGFRVGVGNALGAAQAYLAVSRTAPVGGVVDATDVLGPVTLAGFGSGAGYATMSWPIPDDASRDGEAVWFQWRVTDPNAAGGLALSPVAAITLFAVRSTSPVTADDSHLFATSAAFGIDWRRHAAGADADTFTLRGVVRLGGAASLKDAVLHVSVAGNEIVAATLDASGRARSARGVTPSWTVKVDANGGRFAATVAGLDLRAATSLTDAGGSGSLDLPVTVVLDPAGAAGAPETDALRFSWTTREGRASAGSFSYARDGLASGALRPTSTVLRTRRDASRSLRIDGALDPVGDALFAPTGDLEIRLGSGASIVLPAATMRVTGEGASAVVSYTSDAALYDGTARFTYSARTRTFSLRCDRLPGTVLVPADAAAAELPLSIGTEAGAVRSVFAARCSLE